MALTSIGLFLEMEHVEQYIIYSLTHRNLPVLEEAWIL